MLEVQTPLLAAGTVTDPALAAPTADGRFLQTSTEYHQKRLLAAGCGDNYTLGSVFRRDEAGRLHAPEFTMLEWYRLGFDDRALMNEVEALVALVLGPARCARIPYADLLASAPVRTERELPELDAESAEDLALAEALEALGPGRVLITDFPAERAALARLDSEQPHLARRFELVVDGVELANGYWELCDAGALRLRFEADNATRARRGLPPMPIDEALLAAATAGWPDCAGVALGVDRLLMLKLGAASVGAVQAFAWDRA